MINEEVGGFIFGARRAAKNTLALAVARIAPKFLTALLVIYAARVLGTLGFGRFTTALAFAGIFGVFVELGLSPLFTREIARDKSKAGAYLGSIVTLKLLLALAIYLMLVASAFMLGYSPETRLIIYIVGLAAVVEPISDAFSAVFIAFEQMGPVSVVSLLRAMFYVIGGVLAMMLGYGVIGLAIMFLAASVVSLFSSGGLVVALHGDLHLKLDFSMLWHLIGQAIPFMLTAVFFTLYFRVDVVMLSRMKGEVAVGLYGAPYRIVDILTLIPAVVVGSAFPLMSRLYVSSREQFSLSYKKLCKYMWLLGLPIGFGATLLANRIILLLFGSQYKDSALALQILIWAVVVYFLNTILSQAAVAGNGEKVVASIIGLAVVLNVSLNMFLIPSWGLNLSYVGASISTVLTEGAVFLSLLVYLRRKTARQLFSVGELLKPLVAVGAMSCLLVALPSINLLLLIVLGALVYGSALLAMKTFDQIDREVAFGVLGFAGRGLERQ